MIRVSHLVLALAAAFTLALPAAAATPYDGDWAGVLHAGSRDLRLELHVKSDGKETTAVLDSLDQGATIPSTAVKTDDGQISALFMAVGGELKGKLSADGKTLDGTWVQGRDMPITFVRK